jgi:flagellar basal-body rod protein FlgG
MGGVLGKNRPVRAETSRTPRSQRHRGVEKGVLALGMLSAHGIDMNVSLYHAASALDAHDRWQELIAENLASGAIPGFKKQELNFAAVQAGLNGSAAAASPGQVQAFSLPHGTPATNFLPGELKYTGVPTDIAIDGKAFFEVQLPNGSTGYTRDGEFHLSAQGQLVTKQGYLVLGDGGPLQLDLETSAPLSISATGEVSQGSDLKGTLRLTEFDDDRRLSRVNGSLFLATDPALTSKPSTMSTVRQGWIEGANTSAVMEMANLIAAMRTFETNQKMIQLQDDRMSKTITELGTA